MAREDTLTVPPSTMDELSMERSAGIAASMSALLFESSRRAYPAVPLATATPETAGETSRDALPPLAAVSVAGSLSALSTHSVPRAAGAGGGGGGRPRGGRGAAPRA